MVSHRSFPVSSFPIYRLSGADLWESRREQSAEVPRRAEVIHLYGVDVMSTEEVLVYFRDYSPLRIEWIDDSSCNVIFSSEAAAKRAIVSHGQPFKAGEAPELQGRVYSTLARPRSRTTCSSARVKPVASRLIVKCSEPFLTGT